MTLIVSTIRWLVKYIPVKIFYLSIAAKYLILSKITAIQTIMYREENTWYGLYGCRISTQIHQKGSYDISDAGVISTI